MSTRSRELAPEDVLFGLTRGMREAWEKDRHPVHAAAALRCAARLGCAPPAWVVEVLTELALLQPRPRRGGAASGPRPRLLLSEEYRLAELVELRRNLYGESVRAAAKGLSRLYGVSRSRIEELWQKHAVGR